MGRRIRRGRKQWHLTQEALSERVGISTSFLGHVERGTRKASLETIVKICAALKMSLDEIVLGKRPVPGATPIRTREENLLIELSRLLEPWRETR